MCRRAGLERTARVIHPHLWPAVIGAAFGLPVLALAMWRLFRRWDGLRPRTRWTLLVLLGLVEAGYWLNVYAWLIEPNRLVVREVVIETPHWRGAPLRAALMGDVHIAGPHMRAARVERIVRRVNAERPDIVFLLGDHVAGHTARGRRGGAENQEIENGLAALAMLDAPALAVIGNHDVWYGRDFITQALTEAGVGVLWNRHAIVPRAEGEFVVAGLEDPVTSRPDLRAALDGAPSDLDMIVLAHSPDWFPRETVPFGLYFGAHTHCGQVTIPFVGRPIVPSDYGERYACGRVDENGRTLYVTGGVGTSLLPVRFLNPPEIVIITLKSAGE